MTVILLLTKDPVRECSLSLWSGKVKRYLSWQLLRNAGDIRKKFERNPAKIRRKAKKCLGRKIVKRIRESGGPVRTHEEFNAPYPPPPQSWLLSEFNLVRQRKEFLSLLTKVF